MTNNPTILYTRFIGRAAGNMQEFLVFVNKDGRISGKTGEKLASHNSSTKLHLAFSCYVFDERGMFLVTQRALTKKVWPGAWTNSVCGHPAPGEKIEDAIRRRLDYELGMTAKDIKVILPKYVYKTPPFNGIIEHEFCPVYVAVATSDPNPNLSEVADFKWLSWQEFVKIAENDSKDAWSWWCKDQLKLIKNNPLIAQYSRSKPTS